MLTVKDLLELFAACEDEHTPVYFGSEDDGEVPIGAGFICDDGTLLLVAENDSLIETMEEEEEEEETEICDDPRVVEVLTADYVENAAWLEEA